MTEKKFLSCILTEGILLAIVGLAMLMLPKITSITFGMMLSLSFVIYGGYKAINAIMTRNYTRHFLLNVVLGLILFVLGIFLFLAPMFSLTLITATIGVYFLLESVSTCAFGIQNRKTLYFWWAEIPLAILQFLLGLIIILGLPSTALWVVGVLMGVNFLVAGMIMISMYVATKYVFSV